MVIDFEEPGAVIDLVFFGMGGGDGGRRGRRYYCFS